MSELRKALLVLSFCVLLELLTRRLEAEPARVLNPAPRVCRAHGSSAPASFPPPQGGQVIETLMAQGGEPPPAIIQLPPGWAAAHRPSEPRRAAPILTLRPS